MSLWYSSFFHWVLTAGEARPSKSTARKLFRIAVIAGPAELEEVHILGLLPLALEVGSPVVAHDSRVDPHLLEIGEHGDADLQPFRVVRPRYRHGPEGDLGEALPSG